MVITFLQRCCGNCWGDATADEPSGNKPPPFFSLKYLDKYVDTVHSRGAKICWKAPGTVYSIIEINGSKSDRTYRDLNNNPDHSILKLLYILNQRMSAAHHMSKHDIRTPPINNPWIPVHTGNDGRSSYILKGNE